VTFLGIFTIGVTAGVASQVPGGLGVFEAIVLLAIPHMPTPQLLGTLIAYRAIYYVLPLVLASAALLGHELFLQRRSIGRAGRVAGTWISPLLLPVAPQLIGGLVFVAGAILLVSGATPSIDSRIHLLRAVMPLPLLELSHLAGSVIGVGLLILARGLTRRLNGAYHVTFWLLAAGIGASLLKGLDVEESMFLGIVLIILRLSRPAFYRPSSMLSQRFTPGWLASVGIIVALSVWIGLIAYRNVPYSHDLWWTFAMNGDAPRMLRASLAVVVVVAGVLAMNLLRPAPPGRLPRETIDLSKLGAVLANSRSSLANAALTGDKRFLFNPAGDAFVMYGVSGRSWIALGEPVGPVERREELAWAFRELVDRSGGRAVFYQITTENLPIYLDLGLSLQKLGEEARVPLPDFSLDGAARAALRQAHRRSERSSTKFEIVQPTNIDALLPALRTISDQWLEDKATAEKGFSLGAFSEEYIRHFPVAVIRVADVPVAFANLWPTASLDELSIDLMRFSPDAPNGTMDYLFIELMLWGRQQGYQWFNLGMAPLSGLETRALAPAWQRIGGFLQRHGESFYNFAGLRRYKDKFSPVWEPRYLASPGGMQLPAVLLDVSTLIAGGVRELVSK
jgi:phosphatidylglycerol lysyltransferase